MKGVIHIDKPTQYYTLHFAVPLSSTARCSVFQLIVLYLGSAASLFWFGLTDFQMHQATVFSEKSSDGDCVIPSKAPEQTRKWIFSGSSVCQLTSMKLRSKAEHDMH